MCIIISSASAKIWRVNNAPGISADFTSIPDAVAAAAAGDTIYIEGSSTTYSTTVTIDKKLTLIGPGYYLNDEANEKTQWFKQSATLNQLIFNPGSEGSVVSGLSFNSTLTLNAENITLERCYLYRVTFGNTTDVSCDGDTIRNCVVSVEIDNNPSAGGTFSAKGLMIYNNILFGGADFRDAIDDTEAYFINNTLVASASFHTQNCIYQNNILYYPTFSTYGASNFFTNNIITSTSAASNIPEGNNNQFSVAWSSVFVASNPNRNNPPDGLSHDGQYKLAENSPAIDAGQIQGATVDCGAFGGAAPYILSGMPSIPSIYSLTVPAQVNQGTTSINVSLSAAAH